MATTKYTQDEVIQILTNLVNGIGHFAVGDFMPKRYKELVTVNGQERWVTGKTLKDLLEAYLTLCIDAEAVYPVLGNTQQNIHTSPITFGPYLEKFNAAYKNNQQSLTKNNRTQIINKHILPFWGDKLLDEIKPVDLQLWFNELAGKNYSHETLVKIKNIMSPAFDAAAEEELIQRNPLKSKLLKIGGKETESHKAIPSEKMAKIRNGLPTISDQRVKNMAALLSYTAMRMEEVLGLRWEDIDFKNNWIQISRAVVHPTRNQPEIKLPKSKTSTRRIPLPKALASLLTPKYFTGFIVPSSKDEKRETPMSYTEARRTFDKIRKMFGIEKYTAHDFRDTCATEWREKGIPLDVISSLLGHAKVEVTQKRYVKYRDELFQGVRSIMDGDKGTENGQTQQR